VSAHVGVAVLFLLVTAVGLWVVRPFTTGPIGPDAAAPVIEFERMVAGQRLEGYLSQTSKPLLTLVYGVARTVTGDWRSVSLLAILSFAAFVVCAVWLAHRLGGAAAAAFTATGLALFPALLRDVTFAYGVSWAMLACAVAGIAVTRRQPRFRLAGLALAVGALARPEVLSITAVGVVALGVAHALARTKRIAPPPAGSVLVVLGLLAIPVLSVHDWVLNGDALFWLNTAQANSAGEGTVRSLLGVVRFIARHELPLAPVAPFAALAVLDAAVRRQWMTVVVVAILPLSVAAFFIASGARGTVISARYLLPIDLGVVWAAGIGLASITVPRLRRWAHLTLPATHGRRWALAPVALGAALAVAMVPTWPRDGSMRSAVAIQQRKSANAARAFAAIAPAITPAPPWRGAPVVAQPRTLVLIPVRLRAQGVVDLDLPLWAGTQLFPRLVDPAKGLPPPGTIVYHDAIDDRPSPRWTSLEVEGPTVVGTLRLVPLFVDAKAGIWVLRIEAAPGG
jgi:hypothetical protein